MIEFIDIQALAREIAARMDPAALMDAEDVGALMRYSARHVNEVLAKKDWFPRPVDLDGQRRWRRADIVACIEQRQVKAKKKPGRPRQPAEMNLNWGR